MPFPKSTNERVILSALFFVIIPGIILLSACGDTGGATRDISITDIQVTQPSQVLEPYIFETSEPGYITVHGTLLVLDPMTIVPADDDAIHLVPLPTDQPISGIPPFEAGTVPQADVDERTGEFVFTNIEAGQYAIVVVTRGGAQFPSRFMGTGTYAIITLDESQIDTVVEIDTVTLP